MNTKRFWILMGINGLMGLSSFFFYIKSVYNIGGEAGTGQLITSMVLFTIVVMLAILQFYWFRFQYESTRIKQWFAIGTLLLFFVLFRIYSQQMSQHEETKTTVHPVFAAIDKEMKGVKGVKFKASESSLSSFHPAYIYDFVFSVNSGENISPDLISNLLDKVPSSITKPFLFTFHSDSGNTVISFSSNQVITDCYTTSSKDCSVFRDPLSSIVKEKIRNEIAKYNVERSTTDQAILWDADSSTEDTFYFTKEKDQVERTDVRTIYETIHPALGTQDVTISVAREGEDPVSSPSVVFSMTDINMQKKSGLLTYHTCNREFCADTPVSTFYFSK